jgi:arylsulfatase A-like enzyme
MVKVNGMKKNLLLGFLLSLCYTMSAQQKPNVIFIYADDLGYGDLGCYGATKIKTPNMDKLANRGIRFTNAHSTSASCTPSRYALMTGQYPWRKEGTGILPGDAALIVPTDKMSLPALFKKSIYQTALVGKWHLGLGNEIQKNWNGEIKPGPNELGFDYSFIFPATADRVPTVFVENHQVVASDPSDPIQVDYQKKIGNDPTGLENPELLKLKSSPNHGHNNTIVNGIGRIGFMTGGTKARWTDEEMPLTFLAKSLEFLDQNKSKPFFLFYSLTEPHVPRMPSTMFKGKSGLGLRGDAILQIDWAVGQIMSKLEQLGIDKNTMIILTSDNGPVLDDGYDDEAVTALNGHTPWGALRGGKYSAFEAGSRVPMLVSWPAVIKPGVSAAMISQVDFLASFSALLKGKINNYEATDSENLLDAMIGKSKTGRKIMVKEGIRTLSITRDQWKYIEPSKDRAKNVLVNIELGNDPKPQLYNLQSDIGEKKNVASEHPELVKELSALLQASKNNGKSGNPLFKGWYADPEATIFDKKYWIYPTYSAPYEKQVFMDAFSSKDLITWQKHERIIDTNRVNWAKKAMWAPSIVKKENKYFLFFGANDIQSNAESGGIGVAVSDSPSGPFKDYLGKPLIDKFHNGAQPIDQFVFNDQGKYYMYYGGWKHCNLVQLNEQLNGFIPFDDGETFKEITPEGYVEGPFVFKRNNKYYFMWSEGGWTGPNYSVAYAMADSPIGPFKRIGKILQQDPSIATGAGHHSVIAVPGKDQYYIVYHRRPLNEKDRNSRETCIDEMKFDQNGLILPVKITNEGVKKQLIE